MVYGPSPLGGIGGPAPARDVQRDRVQPSATDRFDLSSSIPSSPPAEVLEALDTAARVLEELASRRLSLRFEYDDSRNQVHVQVMSEDGKVVREIPPSALADIAAGLAMPEAA
jgi:uncharacterized FlaG/YvyC family protein